MLPSSTMPLGRFAFAAVTAVRTSSRLIPYLFNAVGFNSMRTAGSALPLTVTWPIPWIWESFWASMVDAASYMRPRSRVSDVSASIMIGASAGLTLR